MIRIPLYLEIAQWALLFGLGTLVLVLYRQLGRLLSTAGEPEPPGRPSELRRRPSGTPASPVTVTDGSRPVTDSQR